MEVTKSFKLLSPSGNFHYVVATTIFEAINKAVTLDNYLYSNCAYFKVNGIGTPVKVFTNTNYKLN